MGKLIDADELRNHWLYDTVGNEPEFTPNDVLDSIDEMPAVEAEPVIHAEWKFDYGCGIVKYYRCSKCGRMVCSVGDIPPAGRISALPLRCKDGGKRWI